MKPLKHLKHLTLSIFLCLLFNLANAIGDSGGCGDVKNSALGKALTNGGPDDVSREIFARVSYEEKELGFFQKLQIKNIDEWRKKQILDLIEGNRTSEKPCTPGPLLHYAIQSGNSDVVAFLLKTPLGVTPKIPPNILFECDYDPYASDALRVRRRQAFGILLSTGLVDINRKRIPWIYPAGRPPMLDENDNRGPSVLEVCKDLSLISLYIENGARIDENIKLKLLDDAIYDAVSFEEGSGTAKMKQGMERTRFFSKIVSTSIEGRQIETKAKYSCNLLIRSKKWNPETCRELSTFIKSSPGVFGDN